MPWRVQTIVGVLGLLASTVAQAQIEGPVGKIVFPFAAGGQGDALARIVAEKLRGALGRAYIVENRTGAGGRVGIQAVKASAPDGATLLYVPIAPMSIYPHFYDSLGYDPELDFEPISQVATYEFALAVARNVPATSLGGLVAWVKDNPTRGSYGAPGAGTLPHFFAIQFSKLNGLDLRLVGYRGSAALMTDLISGQIPFAITSTSDFAEQHRAGSIRILATSDKQPSQIVQGLPTFKDAGFDIEGLGWYAFYAPARTPVSIMPIPLSPATSRKAHRFQWHADKRSACDRRRFCH